MQAIAIWIFVATMTAAPSLALSATEAVCGVDRYEPNDARGRAKSTRGKPVEARTCGGDVDWYYVKAEAGTVLTVRVEHPVDAPVEVDLFPPRARKPVGERTHADGETVVTLRAEASAKHRIRVRAAAGVPVDYRLVVEP